MNDTVPRSAMAAAVAVAIGCVGLVLTLFLSGFTTTGATAVDDLPRVSEVIVAAAHEHGIELPELTDEEREALDAPPVDATDATAYEQLSAQLMSVKEADGIEQAVFLLGEVAAVSPDASVLCPALYEELTRTLVAAQVPPSPCP